MNNKKDEIINENELDAELAEIENSIPNFKYRNPENAMIIKGLKEKVLNGEVTIFKVTDLKGNFLDNLELNGEDIRDMLIEPNAERMVDLITLYNGQEIVNNGKRYAVICGYPLIAELILETANFIKDSIDETPEREEELFAEVIPMVKVAKW